MFVSAPRFMLLSESRRHEFQRIKRGGGGYCAVNLLLLLYCKEKKTRIANSRFASIFVAFFFFQRGTDGVLHMQNKRGQLKRP